MSRTKKIAPNEIASRDVFHDINFISMVQIGGLVEDNGVVSRGFEYYHEAIYWARGLIEEAHGEPATVVNSMLPISYDLGGDPHSYRVHVTYILSPGGPTNGWVIDLGNTR